MLEQPMRSSDNPEWAGAVWVGELDLSDLASAPSDSRLELAGGSDYHRARFLVREDQALRGFVTVGDCSGTRWIPYWPATTRTSR